MVKKAIKIKKLNPMSFESNKSIFSPDGRLLQLERALSSPNLSSNITFSIFENELSVVFEKKNTQNLIPFKQIHSLSENIFISFCGLCPDFYIFKTEILVDIANLKLKEVDVDIEMVCSIISDIFQTQCISAGRPYGLQILLFGILDEKVKAFIIETDGNYAEYFAGSLGKKKKDVIKVLESSQLDKMTALTAVISEIQNDRSKLDIFTFNESGLKQKEFLDE